MTRYEELCNEFANNYSNYLTRRDDCYIALTSFLRSFCEYLQCSKDCIEIINKDEKPESDILNAMYSEDDIKWNLNAILKLRANVEVYDLTGSTKHYSGSTKFLINIAILKKGREFLIKLNKFNKNFTVYSVNKKIDFDEINSFLEHEIKNSFSKSSEKVNIENNRSI